MEINTIEIGPIRPPDEADSLLIRTTRGCPWNRCRFCTLFRDHCFSIRKVDEIKKDILAARQQYNGAPFETCFLQDGDSFAMRTRDLIEVLKTLKKNFPSLKQISSYGRAQTMGRKSESEMKEIFDVGLNMLYCGIESGSDIVLETVGKGVTSDAIIQASLKARQAGMKLMVFAIAGLGGRALTDAHVAGTADVLNRINPHNIRMMSLAVKGQTELGTMIQNKEFTMLTEIEMVEEQRRLIERLEGIQSRYGNYHIVNLLTELGAALLRHGGQQFLVVIIFLIFRQDYLIILR